MSVLWTQSDEQFGIEHMITGASSIESIKFGSISTISPVSSKIRGILLLVVATLSAVRLEGPGRTLTYNKESSVTISFLFNLLGQIFNQPHETKLSKLKNWTNLKIGQT